MRCKPCVYGAQFHRCERDFGLRQQIRGCRFRSSRSPSTMRALFLPGLFSFTRATKPGQQNFHDVKEHCQRKANHQDPGYQTDEIHATRLHRASLLGKRFCSQRIKSRIRRLIAFGLRCSVAYSGRARMLSSLSLPVLYSAPTQQPPGVQQSRFDCLEELGYVFDFFELLAPGNFSRSSRLSVKRCIVDVANLSIDLYRQVFRQRDANNLDCLEHRFSKSASSQSLSTSNLIELVNHLLESLVILSNRNRGNVRGTNEQKRR